MAAFQQNRIIHRPMVTDVYIGDIIYFLQTFRSPSFHFNFVIQYSGL